MSSERSGTPDEDAEWADYAAWIDRANSPSEQTGTPTHGALNREKARNVMLARFPTAAHTFIDDLLDALEACVVPDPRWQQVEALPVYRKTPDALGWISADAVEAILRGDQ